MPQRSASLLILFNYCAMVLIWGSFPVAARIGVEHAPPLLLSGVRFCLAFAIMAPLALLQRNKLLIARKQHLNVFFISLLMVALPSSIFFIATLYAPVSVLTIMWSVTPIFTALFTMRDKGEVHGWKLFVSLVLGLSGALLFCWDIYHSCLVQQPVLNYFLVAGQRSLRNWLCLDQPSSMGLVSAWQSTAALKCLSWY